MKIPVPRTFHDLSRPFLCASSMCGSCAYHNPLTVDEEEFELSAALERGNGEPMAHACHERKNVLCTGSRETVMRLFGRIEQ